MIVSTDTSNTSTQLGQLGQLVSPARDGNLWLYQGDVGLILYYYYRSIYEPANAKSDQEQALALLEEQIENVGQYLYNYKFGYGITGFAWVMQFLINQKFLEPSSAEALDDIDQYITQTLPYNYEDQLYDLFIGTIGKGLYFLERLDFARTQKDSEAIEKHSQVLETIVEQLNQSVIQNDQGCYWLDKYTSGYEEYRNREPYIGIGLSHGTPSVICFLSRCYQANIAPTTCLALIHKGVEWLRSSAYAPQEYPTRVYEDGEKAKAYDLSWCYGVFSVAASLWVGSRLLRIEAYEEELEALLEKAAAIDPSQYRIDQTGGHKNISCHQ